MIRTSNQIKTLTIKSCSILSHKNIQYYLKLRIPMCHRKLLLKIPQNKESIQNFCNDRKNPFHVVNGVYIIIHNVDKYTYSYSNTNTCIFIRILVRILLCNNIINCILV